MAEGWQDTIAALANGDLTKSMFSDWQRRVHRYTLLTGPNFYDDRLSMLCFDGLAVFRLAEDPPPRPSANQRQDREEETSYEDITIDTDLEHPSDKDVDWLKKRIDRCPTNSSCTNLRIWAQGGGVEFLHDPHQFAALRAIGRFGIATGSLGITAKAKADIEHLEDTEDAEILGETPEDARGFTRHWYESEDSQDYSYY